MTQDEMTALERGAERIAGMNLDREALATIHAIIGPVEIIPGGGAPTRRTPVKGVCVKCGKHYSRHIRVDEFAYCNQDRQSHFTLQREPVKPAEAAPGAITREQYNEGLRLDGIRGNLRMDAYEAEELSKKAWASFNKAEADYFNYLASITAK